jgi:hypothetical protein
VTPRERAVLDAAVAYGRACCAVHDRSTPRLRAELIAAGDALCIAVQAYERSQRPKREPRP